jgi:hypothetical protein
MNVYGTKLAGVANDFARFGFTLSANQIWTELQESIKLHTLYCSIEHNFTKIDRLDLARDGLHFDLITAQWVVDQIINNLTLQD